MQRSVNDRLRKTSKRVYDDAPSSKESMKRQIIVIVWRWHSQVVSMNVSSGRVVQRPRMSGNVFFVSCLLVGDIDGIGYTRSHPTPLQFESSFEKTWAGFNFAVCSLKHLFLAMSDFSYARHSDLRHSFREMSTTAGEMSMMSIACLLGALSGLSTLFALCRKFLSGVAFVTKVLDTLLKRNNAIF